MDSTIGGKYTATNCCYLEVDNTCVPKSGIQLLLVSCVSRNGYEKKKEEKLKKHNDLA